MTKEGEQIDEIIRRRARPGLTSAPERAPGAKAVDDWIRRAAGRATPEKGAKGE